MRVLLDVRTCGNHGIGRYAREIARWLPDVASDLAFTFVRRPDAGPSDPCQGVRDVTISAPPYSIAEQRAIPALVRREAPALLHVPTFGLPVRSLPCPLVVTIHDLIHFDDPRPLRWARNRLYFRLIVRPAIARAAMVIAVSSHTADEIVERLRVDRARIRVIPHGTSFSGPPRDHPEPGASFLCLANPRPHRNVAGLVEGYSLLTVRRVDAPPLLLVGDPGPVALAAVRRHGLDGRVRVLGPVEDSVLLRLYREALAVVVPSHAEGFGLPVLEGMACGTPPAVARIPPLMALAADAGETFDPGCPDEIALALERIADPTRWLARSEISRARAATFTWRRTAEETALVYREALGV